MTLGMLSLRYGRWLMMTFESGIIFLLDMLIGIAAIMAVIPTVVLVILSVVEKKNRSLRIIAPLWLAGIVTAFFLLPFNYNSLTQMAKNYEAHHTDMAELRHYVPSVLDDSCCLRLEINRKGEISMFACCTPGERQLYWPQNKPEREECMIRIGLTQSELDSTILLLLKADCRGLDGNWLNVPDVWYRRPNYMDLLSYIIQDEPMTDEEWNKCIDGYSTVPFCDTVVFLYGGPAFGTDEMPEWEKEQLMKEYGIKLRMEN